MDYLSYDECNEKTPQDNESDQAPFGRARLLLERQGAPGQVARATRRTFSELTTFNSAVAAIFAEVGHGDYRLTFRS